MRLIKRSNQYDQCRNKASLFHSSNTLSENPMSRFVSTLLASIFVFAATSALAADNSPASASEALRLFARCDASLFNALKENPNLFGPAAEVKKRANAATIAVGNPLSEKGRDQVFSEPIDVDGLRLIAWHDEVSYDIDFGGFLFWGFKAEGSLKAVAKKINAVLPASGKLADGGDVWARAEIRRVGDPADSWRPSGLETSTVTPKGSVERVLMLQSDTADQTNVLCTLQGSITPTLLQAMRPDLTNAEYPQ
ncbi:hypothetical protein RAS12_02250 [Achromobacter seleniivolatilans]|uniref:Uncharacterized protein n=1 Tax=Achromobacter seleniivolatilans TaxID=3047478 RepID=A0ABY9M2I2_9BURK|nr:hypothetical protein [Achromobacter sp. R39]WMD21211.1 hypothetical protein RAS12_02250 [Achromobacter sp. R39]